MKSALQEVQKMRLNGSFFRLAELATHLFSYKLQTNKGMHSLSITPGLKTLCYYGNGHFSLHQGQSSIKTVCVELQNGGTGR